MGTVAGRRTNRLVSWNPFRNNWTLNDVEVIWFTFLIIICTFQWISTIHCINVWAGSSLAWSNAFWHVTVLMSSSSLIPFGGKVLANFSNLQCTMKKIPCSDLWFYFMLLFQFKLPFYWQPSFYAAQINMMVQTQENALKIWDACGIT